MVKINISFKLTLTDEYDLDTHQTDKKFSYSLFVEEIYSSQCLILSYILEDYVTVRYSIFSK